MACPNECPSKVGPCYPPREAPAEGSLSCAIFPGSSRLHRVPAVCFEKRCIISVCLGSVTCQVETTVSSSWSCENCLRQACEVCLVHGCVIIKSNPDLKKKKSLSLIIMTVQIYELILTDSKRTQR